MQKEELQGIIISQGKTQEEVAKHLSISSKTFSIKLNKGIFGSDEIEKMIDFLDINDPMWIFFDRKVTFQDTKRVKYIKI